MSGRGELEKKVALGIDPGGSKGSIFGPAPEGMCTYETGLKHRHYRADNGFGQSALELPQVPGAQAKMQEFGTELPQWKEHSNFDGCWRAADGRFLLMEAKSQFVVKKGLL